MMDLIISIMLGLLISLLVVVSLAFVMGVSERKGVTVNPIEYYLRLIDWAYDKGSGER